MTRVNYSKISSPEEGTTVGDTSGTGGMCGRGNGVALISISRRAGLKYVTPIPAIAIPTATRTNTKRTFTIQN